MTFENLLAEREMDPVRTAQIEMELRTALARTDRRPRWFARLRGRSGAVVIAVIAGLTGVGVATAAQLGALPWVSTPGNPTAPAVIVPKVAEAPPCRLSSLTVTSTGRAGVNSGEYLDWYAIRNMGKSVCWLSGYLPFTLNGKALVDGPNFTGNGPGNLRPGATASIAINEQSRTPADTWSCRKRGILPTLEPVAFNGHKLGSIPDDHCSNFSLTPVNVDSEPTPTSSGNPIGFLTAASRLPAQAVAGKVLRFTITLTNPTSTSIPLTPCPSYQVGIYPGPTRVYRLNCSVTSIGPGASATYQMQYEVPANATPSSSKFVWMLVNKAPVGTARPITITK